MLVVADAGLIASDSKLPPLRCLWWR